MLTKSICVYFVLFSSSLLAQNIGSSDSVWLYDLTGKNGITKIQYQNDTIINSLLFQKFSLELTALDMWTMDTISGFADPIHIYNEAGLVLYQWRNENVDTLVNFKASISDKWTLVDGADQFEIVVIDTFSTEINSKSLFTMAYEISPVGSQFFFADTIFEGIGSKYSFLIPFDGYNTGTHSNYGGTLRCYKDDKLGIVDLENSELDGFNLYNDFEYDCSGITSTLNIAVDKIKPNIYPNPSSRYLNFTLPQTHIEIYNTVGDLVLHMNLNDGKHVNIESLLNGVYYIRYGSTIEKFIKH